MPYTLQHTAEAIDYKLNLIDKNKNLLPYPYKVTFPAGLEDAGDGSVLTTAKVSSSKEVQLASYALPAGTYTASIDVTDIIDTTKAVTGFKLKITGASVSSSGQFTLAAETTIQVSLVTPTSGFDTGLLIKPQIEEGSEKTAWVPYMDKIGTYVDERFNGINTKLKVLNKTTLPSVTTADNGNILRVVDGQWASVALPNAEQASF
jgi:hypothetical protein